MTDLPAPGQGTAAQLADLATATNRPEADLLREGIDRLYRIYIGNPPSEKDESTAPFSKRYSDRSAEIVVRQVTPARFMLREPFKYVDRDRCFLILEDNVSDFASVPKFLTWLIPRYGRHTLPALLHDHLQQHLVRPGTPVPEDSQEVTSDEADTIFRQALHFSRVPFVRRWVMWAAVSLRTVFKSSIAGKLAVTAWASLFALLGLAWPVALITAGSHEVGWRAALLPLGAGILLPVLLCRLAGRRWRLSLISGVALTLIAFPGLLALLFGALYYVIERIGMLFSRENYEVIVTPQGKDRVNHTAPS